MVPAWLLLVSALLASATAADGGGVGRCVEVRASSRLVLLGSEVRASCAVQPDCPLLAGGGSGVTGVELNLDRQLLARGALTHGDRSATHGDMGAVVTAVVRLNQSSALLTCCLRGPAGCRLEDGLQLRAGYPPLPPAGLGCETNLTVPSTMTCSWEPDPPDPLLRTSYTLHTRLGGSVETSSYVALWGVYRVVLPRSAFILYQEMTLWVTASNALGDATSDPITVEPMSTVRLETPRLVRVQAGRSGCLQLDWSLPAQQKFLSNSKMTLEAQLQASQNPSQTPALSLATVQSGLVCDLLHGTQYQVQVRVRYQGSSWSGWSPAQTGSTLEKAPVGRLDYWIKEDEKDKHPAYHNVRLFWKPSRGFRPNGRVSYVVSMVTGGRQLCSTEGSSCELRLSRQVRRVSLWAQNSAGRSAPTQVPLLPRQAGWAVSNLTVVSHGDSALLVQWKTGPGPGHSGLGVSDFVVEWRPLLKTNSSSLLFVLANRNQSSLLLTGPFEPYQPYQVSVYPRFIGAIGLPNTATAYCRQKAPSSSPDLKVRSKWQPDVELTWEELPLQERNGIIRSYNLSYWADPKHITVVTVDPGHPRVLLKGLRRETFYSFLLTVSTDGGNRSGSVLTFRTLSTDASDVGVLLALSFFGLSMVAFITFTAWLRYQKRLMVLMCPIIPDPAHSSIRSWSFDTLQDLSWGTEWKDEQPPTVSLSRLSLTALSEKAVWWAEDTSDLGSSVCSSPLSPCGSISYASVLCGAPYAGQRAADGPAAYRRSESSQPLLLEEEEEEERYQNLGPGELVAPGGRLGPPGEYRAAGELGPPGEFRASGELGAPGDVIADQPFFFGEGAESAAGWEEFPMLRALALGDAQD